MSPGARAQWAVVPLPLPAAVQDGGRSPALWHLAGVPLLQRAVAALVASRRVDHVLVQAAPEASRWATWPAAGG